MKKVDFKKFLIFTSKKFKFYLIQPLLYIFLLKSNVIANNSFYLSLANQLLQKAELDQLSNNISNKFSAGYREDHFIIGVDKKKDGFHYTDFPKISQQFFKTEQGNLILTDSKLDIAFIDNYYFKLMTEQGIKYSVEGRMLINNQNIIVNHVGYPYLDNNDAPIQLAENYQDFSFAEDGSIFVDGENIARISAVNFPPEVTIYKHGNNLYVSDGDPLNVENFRIFIGGYRQSNVNQFDSMIKLSNIQKDSNVSTTNISDINKLISGTITKFSIK
ncbi:MAG: hypothetical protein ISN64_01125 [Rickettsia sp.]|nr:hypothetical protein [Rickettsia sp.]